MDHRDLRRAHSSGQEGHVCSKCGWPFPNAHPSARHRRAHKKVCGTVEGYSNHGSVNHSVSDNDDDERRSDRDVKTPSPKVVERSVYEKFSGGIRQGSVQSEDGVFLDAAAEFSDPRTGERSGNAVGLGSVVERSAEKDLSAIPFRNDGDTTERYASEDTKKINGTDSMVGSCFTSVEQEAEVTAMSATHLDRNVSAEASSMSVGKTEESNVVGGANGFHPAKYEMVADVSKITEKTGDTDGMQMRCLTSIDQEAEVSGTTTTNLDGNMILPSKVAGETVEELEGASGYEGKNKMSSEHQVVSSKECTSGFDVHFPQMDLSPKVESTVHVDTSADTAEKKINNADGVQCLNSGKLIETRNADEGGNASVLVLSVPDDLHVLEDPVLMLEDIKDQKGKQLDRFISCLDSWEQFEDVEYNVKQPVFNENLNILLPSHLSGGTVVQWHHNLESTSKLDDSSSKPMIKHMSDEGEVGSPDDYEKGHGEENHVANPVATVQSADCFENQIYPALNLQKDDDAGDYEKGAIEKCVKFEDAGYNEKADNNLYGDDTSKTAEKFSRDCTSNLETVSCQSELQVNQVTIIHEGGDAAGDCENDKTGKFDLSGYYGDLKKAENCISSGEDLSKVFTDKSFLKDPTTNLESVIVLSNSQIHPAKQLHDVDDSAACDDSEVGKFVISGNESMVGSFEKNILGMSELTPECSVIPAKAVVEDATRDSKMEVVGSSGPDMDIGSNSSQIAGKFQQLDVENEIACSDKIKRDIDAEIAAWSYQPKKVKSVGKSLDDYGEEEPVLSDLEWSYQPKKVKSFGESLDDYGKEEPELSDLNAEAFVQSFTAFQDSSSQKDPAVASAISSQSLFEEGNSNLVSQQPSPTANDLESNSQTDSLEANWGSFSVLSMKSDPVTDAEVMPHTHSQASFEENTNLKNSKAECESPFSDKSSDMFEPPSFKTFVKPRGADDRIATDSETLTVVQKPEQSKPASLQTERFPSSTHAVSESQERKKNEEIIAKATNWSTEKQHTPLKSLLGEASSKGKPLNPKQSLDPAPQKFEKPKVTKTVNSILGPESPTEDDAKKEHAKDWNSPARYPSDKSEKKKGKGRFWVQFVCCASVE